ncbi:MAG: hypothetical protein IKZ82_06365 [Clostridia bacterium]|nr:hypothetical protein [Clostridia bacterium]
MATAKKEPTVNPVAPPAAPEKVQLFIPRGNPSDPDVFISVNSVNYILPRGRMSVVPDYVAQEYYRGEAAKDRFDKESARRLYKG